MQEIDNAHILIVEDDNRTRNLLTRKMISAGFWTTAVPDTSAAEQLMRLFRFDLMVLDILLPKENGIDFATRLRKYSDIPILILSALDDLDHISRALEIGQVDDYLSKPFNFKELQLRILAILRRSSGRQQNLDRKSVVFGDFSFDIARGVLHRGSDRIGLTDSEIRIMCELATRANRTVPRERLMDRKSLTDQSGQMRKIDVRISRLRRKIEAEPGRPEYILTTRGVGYLLCAD